MPHKSLYADVDVPDIDIWELLFERKARPFTDSKEIFTDAETGRTYAFGDLRSTALEFGKGLKALWGWKRGDVMAFYTPNSVDTPAVTLGLLWAGGVASPANPTYTADELAFQLRDSGSAALVTQVAVLDTARKAAAAAGIPDDRIILLGDQQDPTGRFRHFSAVRSTAYCGTYARTKIAPRTDLAFLVYSSGTTGLPKGVSLSHRNIVANVLQTASFDEMWFHPYGGLDGKGDKSLGVLPFFHIYGLTCNALLTSYTGLQCVVMARFDMEKTCQLIERYGITYVYVPPPIVLAFAKDAVVDRYDVSSLRWLHSGAAPLTRELAESLWARLRLPVKQGYGLSETSPVTHAQRPEEWAKHMGSVGRLLPNMETKIVDLEGNEVPVGQEGELWIRGPNIFLGYHNQPDKTRDSITEDGFFKTGDIFRMDEKGFYYCTDRLKELIKYKGFQVAPAELEGLLLGHEHVHDAAVIGVHDPAQATELPRAYVVLHPDHHAAHADAAAEHKEAKAREIHDWCAARTAPHKKLRGGVHFVPEIPKSPSGKILRRALRDRVKQEERKAGAKL